MEQQSQTSKIATIPPRPPLPLPDILRDTVLQALFASGTSVPRIQAALAGNLDGPGGFSEAMYELILGLVRDQGQDGGQVQGNELQVHQQQQPQQLSQEEIAARVMQAVREAREGRENSKLNLPGDARQRLLQVVRDEVKRVSVVQDAGVDTPFGRMY